jgi:hypothetical protein
VTDATAPANVSGREYLRLIGLAAAIGVPAALLAAVFLALIDQLQGWLWDDLPDALDYVSPRGSSCSGFRSSVR